jgi:ABC-type glycerol-3-phosphate transport system substrate-binding protein
MQSNQGTLNRFLVQAKERIIMDFSSRFSRRNFVKTAVTTAEAATPGGVLAVCGAAAGTGDTLASTVTIMYWDWFVSQAPRVDNEIKFFQQAHPDIKIKKNTQGTENYDNLYALAFKSHNAPDVAMIPQKPKTNIQSALSDLAARMQKAQDDAITQAQQKGYKVSAADYTFPDWDLTKPYVTRPAQS